MSNLSTTPNPKAIPNPNQLNDKQWISDEYARRKRLLDKLRANPQALQACKIHYKHNPVDFINDWGMTYDPRVQPSVMPMQLWPRQREFIDWLHQKWLERKDGLVEKSRDAGVTWLCCQFSWWLWTFYENQNVGFGSRKEDLVDSSDDPDSIFEKIRFLIDKTPYEFKPQNYNRREHDRHLRISNPQTSSTIKGEAGDNIGRGGRAQPLDAKILTPFGWMPMGKIKKGNFVIGSDGRPVKVLGVFPQGLEKVYQVAFQDGSTTECSGSHLWQVTDKNTRKSTKRAAQPKKRIGNYRKRPDFLVLTTDEIMRRGITVNRDQLEYIYQIPMVKPVQYSSQKLPIDPYVIGSFIGDGDISNIHRKNIGFTTADFESIQEINSRLPNGYELIEDGSQYGYRLRGHGRKGRGKKCKVKQAFYKLGLNGKKSKNKFIPDVCKTASVEDRIELLRGLLDTDGWLSRPTKPCFVTISKRLALDVIELVQSLGGVGTMAIRPGAVRTFPQGKTSDCSVSYHLNLSLPTGINPFRLSRKADKYKDKQKYPVRRTIISIEESGVKETQCIQVDNDDGLYVTDNFIVTHNTSVYMVDEAAFLERPDRIDAALSQNSDVKIHVSTPNGNGNPFYRKRHGGKIDVFIFDWRDDPRKDDKWYLKQKNLLDPVIVAQEIDRDYNASVTNAFIDATLVEEAMRNRPTDFDEQFSMPAVLGVDPARFGDDRTAIACRQGRIVFWLEAYKQIDTMQCVGIVINHIDNAPEPIGAVFVDEIGIGAGVVDRLREHYTGTNLMVIGVNVSHRSGRAGCFSKRDEIWQELKDWLQAGPVSLPNSDDLRTDLCALQYKFNSNGQLVIESKEDAKKRGVKSPDLGEAIGVTFAQPITWAHYQDDEPDYAYLHDGRSSVTGY